MDIINYQKRRQTLQEKLRRKKISCLIVSRPENRRYLSGYSCQDHGISESAGVLFIPGRGKSLLLTDFRFKLDAEKQTDLEVILYPKGLYRLLDELLGNYRLKSLAFESDYTLHSCALKLTALTEKHGLQAHPVTGLIESMRLIKDETEIDLIGKSVRANETVFNEVYAHIDPEMTEIELAIALETAMRKAGAEHPSFDTIVASGPNGAKPHAVPTTSRLGSGKSVTIDMGLVLSGYCSDMTRNFVIGTPDKRYTEIHRLVRKAQKAGIAAVRAGATSKEVDRAARSIISDKGYGKYFGHALGHGVGLAVHEDPRVSGRSRKKFKPGMVITIEPGIYIPGWGGIRLENMVVVRENGCEDLNLDTTWLDI